MMTEGLLVFYALSCPPACTIIIKKTQNPQNPKPKNNAEPQQEQNPKQQDVCNIFSKYSEAL